MGAARAGLLHTSRQANFQTRNLAYWPPKPLSASKLSGTTLSGVFQRNGGNTERLPPQTDPHKSPPSVNTYVVKSRNSYVRGKVFLSKTSYTSYHLEECKTGKLQWYPRQHRYRNTVSHNVKGFKEPQRRINTIPSER